MPKRYEVSSKPAPTTGKFIVAFALVEPDPNDPAPDPQPVEVSPKKRSELGRTWAELKAILDKR